MLVELVCKAIFELVVLIVIFIALIVWLSR